MSTDVILHLIEIVFVGAPLWYGVSRFIVVLKEYPPHRHINGKVEFPRGMEPPVVRNLDGI